MDLTDSDKRRSLFATNLEAAPSLGEYISGGWAKKRVCNES